MASGALHDQETGLFYNWNRYFDPRTCRYTSSDSIGLAGGLNLYRYANNNPLRYTDPNGLSALSSALPFAGGAAAADGPLPLGDAAALLILGGAAIYDAFYGPVVIDPSKPIPPQLPGYVPESQRRTETRVPTNLLPPGSGNFCDNQLAANRKQCESSCSNVASKAACMTKALVKYLVCKGKPSWPGPGGDDGGDGGGPVWTPGGGF